MRNKDERLSHSAALVVESIHFDTAATTPCGASAAGGVGARALHVSYMIASTLSYARSSSTHATYAQVRHSIRFNWTQRVR
jgi:hypothetical protein